MVASGRFKQPDWAAADMPIVERLQQEEIE